MYLYPTPPVQTTKTGYQNNNTTISLLLVPCEVLSSLLSLSLSLILISLLLLLIMKQSFHSQGFVLVLVVLVFFFHSTSATRLLIPKQVEKKEVHVDGVLLQEASKIEIEKGDSMNLMGMEQCENDDEECLKRRMITEAHLDYIYTQHHHP